MTANYPPPVDKLLTLGDPRGESEWPDYLASGIGAEQSPDLIRMALDQDLNTADSESKQVWAPLHAWRALGQLHVQAAIEPLLHLFPRIDEDQDDWVSKELPEVYGMIGPTAIPALARFLADGSRGPYARIAASDGIEQIAQQHSEARPDCVTAISRQLEKFEQNGSTLNAFLISNLLDLQAVGAAPIIERAFAANKVDKTVAGDWEDVQIELGLKDERTTPRVPSLLSDDFDRIIVRVRDADYDARIDRVMSQMKSEGILKLPHAQKDKPKKDKKKK